MQCLATKLHSSNTCTRADRNRTSVIKLVAQRSNNVGDCEAFPCPRTPSQKDISATGNQINGVLLNGRIDVYQSPDDQGLNQEFWLEMTLERDPSIRLLVTHSDDAPLSGGVWLDGVFVYRNGKLEPV